MCPPGEGPIDYTNAVITDSDAGNDVTSLVVSPSTNGGYYKDGTTNLVIDFNPAVTAADIELQFKLISADSVTVKYTTSDGTTSQDSQVCVALLLHV